MHYSPFKLIVSLRATGLALLCVLLLGACGESPSAYQRLAADAVILAFGDSLTRGTGAADNASYPSRLEELSGRTVVNAGVPGELSAAGLRRLPGLLDRHSPALLILCHGGNDFLRRRNKAALRDNLIAMIEAARARSVPVLLVGIPAPGLFLSTAEVYTEVAQQTGVAIEDAAFADVLDEKSLKSDSVHPNAAGYARIAQTIYRRLQELGAL